MNFPNAGNILTTLIQGDGVGGLARRVEGLEAHQFITLLDFITAEFQQYTRAIEFLNDSTLETILEELLDAFTLKIGQILKAERTTIFLLDGDRQQLWSKVTLADGTSKELRLPSNVGILGQVASTGQGVTVATPQEHPLFNKEVDEFSGDRAYNLLCAPIFSSKNKGQVMAVVQLLNQQEQQKFSEEDLSTFENFSDTIGIILESCQSFYRAAQNQRGVSALLNATTSLGQSLDLETTLKTVMDQARQLLKADRSTLFLLAEDSRELWTKIAKADGKTMMEIRIPSNKGIAGYVASTGKPLNISDAYEDPRFDPSTDKKTGYITRNILCMPVFNSEGDLIGVTQLINKHQGSFTQADEFFMEAFNIQAGIALENAKLFQDVNVEKQYQKDILQSLSDAVISTDMQGKIVTINEAALELLGCPIKSESGKYHQQVWEESLIGCFVWEAIPIESLKFRLEDSLSHAARHYVPEQSVVLGIYTVSEENILDETAIEPDIETLEKDIDQIEFPLYLLATLETEEPETYRIWYGTTLKHIKHPTRLPKDKVSSVERSINLTVTPLTNPEGGVRGGLVVLEDISREKRMKTAMYRYMTPNVAEQVMALGEDALMVGERKDVTILFSDIRGYTTMTENFDASEVVTLLNQYFETMVEAVFNFEGTLDKFIGDALMAVFGAPLPLTENHAWMAIRSALDMRRRLAEFNQQRIIKNQPKIQIGIGVSSGEVVSGNIGSQKRMDYTVIGDGVNLSARLESLTKEYGCDIIISEYTYNLCADRIWVREIDKIRVKGKKTASSIYELIDVKSNDLNRETTKFLLLYKVGREDYLERNFEQAIACFEAALKLRPNDRPSQILLETSREYLRHEPPPDWDGVRTMTHK
ncbi:GAF domain-containing protein [Sodalinema gerasimenkoae]|uniref:GAF domain-containing protein n=1 Tax=Sodalinema gerasimenkoae TaxID=2862348 RepID=UPI00135A10B4|nr:GAF domain-containing protein [Sodalinema gerasimenkoae]MCH8506326.1 GAF domain-containing protein [Ectothiorhodospiraceae bacterium]